MVMKSSLDAQLNCWSCAHNAPLQNKVVRACNESIGENNEKYLEDALAREGDGERVANAPLS